MIKFSSFSKPGWLAAGAIGLLILAPSAAVATSTGLTELIGSGGQRADVTNAGQLTTAEAAPRSFVARTLAVDASGKTPCATLPVISRSKGFVLTEIAVNPVNLTAPAPNSAFTVIEGSKCGSASQTFAQINPSSLGLTVLPINPGIAIPKGGTLTFEAFNDVTYVVSVFGYTVPASDAPGYTPVKG